MSKIIVKNTNIVVKNIFSHQHLLALAVYLSGGRTDSKWQDNKVHIAKPDYNSGIIKEYNPEQNQASVLCSTEEKQILKNAGFCISKGKGLLVSELV